ncbi:hypothetical protein [Dongia sedimenti]|uniref:Uncharacterized protein n=1 Tax=Dongia sedimenti TaxID=3064282 RepID=A0ABU0YPR4_9PROT|nr:hypothetical protein [Rhodospirillaceae bacterium R-7]
MKPREHGDSAARGSQPRERRGRDHFDWGSVILAGAFVLIIPLPLFQSGVLNWLADRAFPNAQDAYEGAIAAAAVRNGSDEMDLQVIDAGKASIEVGTFANKPPKDLGRDREMWVFLPEELQAKCKGTDNPGFAIRQILGLPPPFDHRDIYKLTVPPSALFRPCFSGTDPSSKKCEFSAPKYEDLKDIEDAEEKLARLEPAYNRLWFMVDKLSKTYRVGTYDGYPFTGMGWTYDWRRSQSSHYGVTEFIVPKETQVAVGQKISPEDFCAEAKP